jgi:hypothetical protein
VGPGSAEQREERCTASGTRGSGDYGDGALSDGRPLRVFYAFDPRRSAILLIGGDKTGDDRFYERMIPIADQLYDVYIAEIRREGLIP